MNAEELGRGIPNTPIGRGSVAGSFGGSEDDLAAEGATRSASRIGRDGEEDLETGAGNEAIGDGVGRARRSSTRDRDGNGRSNARHRRWSSRGVEEGNGHGMFAILRPLPAFPLLLHLNSEYNMPSCPTPPSCLSLFFVGADADHDLLSVHLSINTPDLPT